MNYKINGRNPRKFNVIERHGKLYININDDKFFKPLTKEKIRDIKLFLKNNPLVNIGERYSSKINAFNLQFPKSDRNEFTSLSSLNESRIDIPFISPFDIQSIDTSSRPPPIFSLDASSSRPFISTLDKSRIDPSGLLKLIGENPSRFSYFKSKDGKFYIRFPTGYLDHLNDDKLELINQFLQSNPDLIISENNAATINKFISFNYNINTNSRLAKILKKQPLIGDTSGKFILHHKISPDLIDISEIIRNLTSTNNPDGFDILPRHGKLFIKFPTGYLDDLNDKKIQAIENFLNKDGNIELGESIIQNYIIPYSLRNPSTKLPKTINKFLDKYKKTISYRKSQFGSIDDLNTTNILSSFRNTSSSRPGLSYESSSQALFDPSSSRPGLSYEPSSSRPGLSYEPSSQALYDPSSSRHEIFSDIIYR